MDEETQKIIGDLKKRIEELESDLSSLKDELGNHRHDSDGITSHNY